MVQVGRDGGGGRFLSIFFNIIFILEQMKAGSENKIE